MAPSIKADGKETRQSSYKSNSCVGLIDIVSSEDSLLPSRNSMQALLESRYCIQSTWFNNVPLSPYCPSFPRSWPPAPCTIFLPKAGVQSKWVHLLHFPPFQHTNMPSVLCHKLFYEASLLACLFQYSCRATSSVCPCSSRQHTMPQMLANSAHSPS